MLVGIVSDSHGNVDAVRQAAARFQAAGVDYAIHLGDDYSDIGPLQEAGLSIIAVPGVYCPEYSDPLIPNRRVETLGGVKVLLSHTPSRHRNDQPGDLDPEAEASEVSVVLYGHTHIPALAERQGTLWVNPGHLKTSDAKGYPPSYALMHLTPENVTVKIVALETGDVLQSGEKSLGC